MKDHLNYEPEKWVKLPNGEHVQFGADPIGPFHRFPQAKFYGGLNGNFSWPQTRFWDLKGNIWVKQTRTSTPVLIYEHKPVRPELLAVLASLDTPDAKRLLKELKR